MRTLFIRLAVLLWGIVILSCSGPSQHQKLQHSIDNPAKGLWQDQAKPSVQFTLEQTYGDNEKMLLPQIYKIEGPVTDTLGNVYFIDGQQGTLYSFDAQGTKRWQTGEKGKGPGDFKSPRGLATDGKYLYTANVSGNRIDKFDFEGHLVTSQSLEQYDLSFASVEGFLSDSLLVATSSTMGKVGQKITILNTADSLTKVSQFEVVTNPELDMPKSFGFSAGVTIVDSLIATGNVATYELQFYNYQGKQVKTISRDFHKLMRPGLLVSGPRKTIRGYGSLNAPVAISGGYMLVTLNWPTNVQDPDRYLKRSQAQNSSVSEVKYRNAIDLYSARGHLLYSLEQPGEAPKIGRIVHVDRNGNIYSLVSTPFPQIRRYSVAVTSPDK